MPNEIVPAIDNTLAKLTITYNGQQGDLPDPVPYDATEATLKQMATESVRDGYVPGIDATAADFTDFVVDRFPARDDVRYNRLSLRPKTPFGTDGASDGTFEGKTPMKRKRGVDITDRELGIKAIIYLQKSVCIDESRERASASWDSFPDSAKRTTLETYKLMGGK